MHPHIRRSPAAVRSAPRMAAAAENLTNEFPAERKYYYYPTQIVYDNQLCYYAPPQIKPDFDPIHFGTYTFDSDIEFEKRLAAAASNIERLCQQEKDELVSTTTSLNIKIKDQIRQIEAENIQLKLKLEEAESIVAECSTCHQNSFVLDGLRSENRMLCDTITHNNTQTSILKDEILDIKRELLNAKEMMMATTKPSPSISTYKMSQSERLAAAALKMTLEVQIKKLKMQVADEQTLSTNLNRKTKELNETLVLKSNALINSEENARLIATELVELSHLAPVVDTLLVYIESNYNKLHTIGAAGYVEAFANESLRQLREYEAGFVDKLIKRVVENQIGNMKDLKANSDCIKSAKYMTPKQYKEYLKNGVEKDTIVVDLMNRRRFPE